MKRLLAIILTLVMVMSMVSMVAFAEEETCYHVNSAEYEYVSNGNNTHKTVCGDCGATVFAAGNCYFEEGVCISCGAEYIEPCHHNGNNFEYVSNGDNTHNTVCTDCEATIFEGAACAFEDGKCVACGAEKYVETCHHNGNNFAYVSTGDNAHSTICKDCGETIFEGAACHFEDGVCVACGAEEICFHAGNNYEYVSDGKNTHKTVCKDCGKTLPKSENTPCHFEDGKCVACGTAEIVKDEVNNVPQTGDNATMMLWMGLVAFGVIGMSGAIVYGKKVNRF